MKQFKLMLSSINDVKDFVNIVSKYDFDVDLTSGRYVVEVHSDNCDAFLAELKNFIVE